MSERINNQLEAEVDEIIVDPNVLAERVLKGIRDKFYNPPLEIDSD